MMSYRKRVAARVVSRLQTAHAGMLACPVKRGAVLFWWSILAHGFCAVRANPLGQATDLNKVATVAVHNPYRSMFTESLHIA